ncbi:MAG: oxidative damage protection protein [Acidiferrobacteraceae bacterium]|jgi:Fe-S cluster biosynthesis and repair protein YggX|nr:oxidative damage protection protein [Acidiferrobacteraceae bacterium]MBT4396599.1 oxidative damage protection protein [Acidiferrobacteraceae bacterium]
MSKKVDCVVLGRQAPALETAPWPGDLGERIVQQVSLEGWQQWLARQTMLMNEKRLSPINPEHRAYLERQMEAFLFGDGGDSPEGWVSPKNKKS